MTATIDLHVAPMSCFRLVTRRFSSDDSLLRAVLDGVGVEPEEVEDPGLEVTYAQLMREFENLNRLVGEHWLLEVRELCSATAQGALGLVVSTAPTVGAAAQAFARYLNVYTPYQQASVSRRPGGILLRHTPTRTMSSGARRRIDEMLLMVMGEMIAGMLGARRTEIRFEHPWIEPAHGSQIEAALGAPVRWGAGVNAILVPDGLLAVRSPLADPALHQAAIERLEQARRATTAPATLRVRLNRLLARSETGRLSMPPTPWVSPSARSRDAWPMQASTIATWSTPSSSGERGGGSIWVRFPERKSANAWAFPMPAVSVALCGAGLKCKLDREITGPPHPRLGSAIDPLNWGSTGRCPGSLVNRLRATCGSPFVGLRAIQSFASRFCPASA